MTHNLSNNSGWNPYHIPRPEGNFSYRTHISAPDAHYRVFAKENIITQMLMYHWCRSIDFVNGAAIADVYNFVFHGPKGQHISKRHVGQTILQALSYDPRLLKGKTKVNDRATMTYVFRHREDLQYGLEWMLSMWIWRLVDTQAVMKQRSPEEKQNRVLDILDQLARTEDDDLYSVWVQPAWEMEQRRQPDWATIWVNYDLEMERPRVPERKERPKLRSLV